MQFHKRTTVRVTIILLWCVILAGCGASAKEYNDLSAAGPMAQSLCFRVEHLPEEFEVIARLMQDNATSAQYAPDPQQRERDYAEWGRVVGSFHQWAFEPPSMPDEDADGRMTDEEIERELQSASAEQLAASFRSATCNVDVYSSESGARQAFDGELGDLIEPSHLSNVAVTEVRETKYGQDSAMVVHHFSMPELTRFTILIRVDYLLAEMSVSATCDHESSQDCSTVLERALSLGSLLDQRLAGAIDGSEEPVEESTPSTRERARSDCATRDFSGCVDQYVAHAEAGDNVALCRSEYGGWYFEPPHGEIGQFCSDDDYIITAIVLDEN